MTGLSTILDIVISLFLIYFVFANLSSVILELINSKRQKRQKFLKKTILKVLDDPLNKNYGELFYRHPSIDKIRRNHNRLPAYIASEQFADVVIELMAKEGADYERNGEIVTETKASSEKSTFEKYQAGVNSLKYSDLRILLNSFIGTAIEADKTLEKLKSNIASWYDNYMERVTGWYKHAISKETKIVAIALVLIFNVDTIKIYRALKKDTPLREQVVKSAIQISTEFDTDSLEADTFEQAALRDEAYYDQKLKKAFSLVDSLSDAGIPLGWLTPDEIVEIKTNTMKQKCEAKSKKTKMQHNTEIAKKKLQLDEDLLLCLEDGGCQVNKSDQSWNITYIKDSCNCFRIYRLGLKKVKQEEKQFKKEVAEKAASCVKCNLECVESNWWDTINAQIDWWSILGWLISALAIAQGASFWFDNLLKLVNIRQAGIKPKTTKQ